VLDPCLSLLLDKDNYSLFLIFYVFFNLCVFDERVCSLGVILSYSINLIGDNQLFNKIN
jgi:hypothetical protein